MKKLLLIAPLALLAIAGTTHISNSVDKVTESKTTVLKANALEDEVFLVYFHAPETWTTPNIWPWNNAEGTNPYNPLGWPGRAMHEDTTNDGWYYMYVPNYVDMLIFSYTDSTGTLVQTNGDPIPTELAGQDIWVDGVEKDAEDVLHIVTPTAEKKTTGDLPEYLEERFAFAKVPNDWDKAVATFTSSTDSSLTKTMELTLQSDEIWFGGIVSADYDTITINNGEEDNLKESMPVTIEGSPFYVEVIDEKDTSGKYKATIVYEKPVEAAEGRPIHAKVPDDWEEVAIWAFEDASGTGQFTTWPGEQMTLDEDGEWWTYESINNVCDTIIINQNLSTGLQTVDIEGVEPKEAWIVLTTTNSEGKYEAEVYYEEPTLGGDEETPTTPEEPDTEDPSKPDTEEPTDEVVPAEEGLPAWGIALIVIGALVVVGVIGGLVYHFTKKRKK